MKRIVNTLSALAVLAAMVIVATTSTHCVRPVYAQTGCSLASLNGDYAFSQQGSEPAGVTGPLLPFAVVGVSKFDGAGNVSFAYTDVSPGRPNPYQPLQGTGSGTYTLKTDCTGSASCTSGDCAGVTLNMAVIGGGREVFGINTTRNVVAAIDLKKQEAVGP
jgi:hypothetical protein